MGQLQIQEKIEILSEYAQLTHEHKRLKIHVDKRK